MSVGSERGASTRGVSESILSEYRDWLVKAQYEGSKSYDRAVMTLSGGALGVSIAFLRDVVPTPNPSSLWALQCGWTALTMSLVAIFVSIWTSQRALLKAIEQCDAGEITEGPVGGDAGILTDWLNTLAGFAFIFGVAFLLFFVFTNLEGGSGA